MKRQYSIKDLEKLSGIKAHTIRIWEKRYNLLEPNRTATNIRYYNDTHLKKILDVSILQRKGLKISKISHLNAGEIKRHVEDYYKAAMHQPTTYEAQIHQLIKTMLDFDEATFEKVFSSLVLKMGLEEAVRHVIFPFMMRVGILWNLREIHPGQEHFVTNLVKQKLFSAIDGVVAPQVNNQTFLLYLIENELHELSLLFAAYLLKKKGREVIYLGQSVPFESLHAILEQRQVTHLITIFTTHKPIKEFQLHLDKMSNILGSRTLYLSGDINFTQNLDLHSNMKFLKSFDQFFTALD